MKRDGVMKKAKLTRVAFILCLVTAVCIPLTACSKSGQSADPGTWGFECKVIYDALGGMVNAREVRTTYYLPNSYVFEPSGSSNMLVEPVRDGYILAGWYTAKTDEPTEYGEEYTFNAADRWDFYLDRVQDDMTLYARWLPRGKVDYVNADTGEIIFSKNITGDSPVQELSDAVVDFRKPENTTLFGYYSDAACTQEYDFSSYVHSEPHPSEAALYAALYEEFPQYLEQVEYVEPEEDEIKETDDMSYLFLNKLGYQMKSTDEQALRELREAKDWIVEESIQNYLVNTAEKVAYMKFVDGNIVRVNTPGDIKIAGSYGFFGTDALGNKIDGYVIENDVDFSGITLTMSDSFSGMIYGNGHKLSNISLSVSSRKIDNDTEKGLALFGELADVEISDLTFENAQISIQVKEGIPVNAALLALSAQNVAMTNCRIDGMTINSGNGDTGSARYTLGDLFVSAKDVTLTDCSGSGLVANVLNPDRLKLLVLEAPEELAEDDPAGTEP
jgi:uncharacterized repeat protein (TIGR02543 family)